MNTESSRATDPTRRFSNRVEDYIRYRPGYPPEVLDYLTCEFGLAPQHVIADVGSGTGILTELLLRHGNAVLAVEPNAEMRAAAERLLHSFAGFRSVAGTAELTTLPAASVDWITAGQAFHWFDVDRTRLEFARILRRGTSGSAGVGWVALLWNNRREHTPFLQEYERLLREFSTDYATIKHQNVESDGRLARFFGAGAHTLRTFSNRQLFDFDGLKGRTLSASYMPAEGQPHHAPMLAALAQLFAHHAVNGQVVLEYDTQVYVGRVGDSA